MYTLYGSKGSGSAAVIHAGTRARLHALWDIFADTFPSQPFLNGEKLGAPDLLAAVVSKWSGTRKHLAQSRPAFGGTPVSLMIYVEDVDRIFRQALAAGAKELRPVVDQFYGDRSGTLIDPFGHMWTVATHVEDVSPEEIEKRMAKMMQG